MTTPASPQPGLRRIVSVTRAADRHADLHEREFAETREATVPDGPLPDLVADALRAVAFEGGARFVITVEEPHE